MSQGFWIQSLGHESRDRLKQVGIQVPRSFQASRTPTPAELCETLKSLKNFKVQFEPKNPRKGERWQIEIRENKRAGLPLVALITISHFPGADKPLPLVHIEGDDPELAASLAVELARTCGPLLLDGENSYGPHLVNVGSQVDAVLAALIWAAGADLELAFGSFVIQPLTLETAKHCKKTPGCFPHGTSVLAKTVSSRGPTPIELKNVLDGMRGYRAEFSPGKPRSGETWQIVLYSRKGPATKPAASIAVKEFQSVKKPIPSIVINGALELLEKIVVGLITTTGPLVIDGGPIFGVTLIEDKRAARVLETAMGGRALERAIAKRKRRKL